LKKTVVVQNTEAEVNPFVVDDFIQVKQVHGSMSKVTKKDLKSLADALGLTYDDKQIGFTKKLMMAYLER